MSHDVTAAHETDETTDRRPSEEATGSGSSTADKTPSGLRPVLFYSLLAGLCPLLPVPFLDDVLVGWIRRMMVTELFETYGIKPTSQHRKTLTARKTNRLVGCLKMVIVYPVKKIFRKVFYFLAIKEAVDVASSVLHEGFLIRAAIVGGQLSACETESLERVRDAIAATLDDVDTSPITGAIRRVFRGSRVLVNEVKGQLGSSVSEVKMGATPSTEAGAAIDSLREEDPAVSTLLERLTSAVWAKESYLADLEEVFWEHLAQEDSSRSATSSSSSRP